MSDKKRKKLNLKAGRLIESVGISFVVTENGLNNKKLDVVGYADYYLMRCRDETELKNKADVIVYKKLLNIDSKLGTTQSEQLFECVFHSLRMDLIKV